MADGKKDDQSVEFFGESLRLNPEPSEFAMLEFAQAADEGQDGESLAGMASLLRFVTEIVHPDDRAKFKQLARKNRASSKDLIRLLGLKVEDETDRPTGRLSDSSDGPSVIAPKSEPSYEEKVSQRFPGRPDLQLAVLRSRKTA